MEINIAKMEGLFAHPVLSNDVVGRLIENMNKKMIATCNKIDNGLNSVFKKY